MRKAAMAGDKALVRFIFELGQLRRERRHGWLRIFEDPESVAEHMHRAAALAYVLALREGFSDPARAAAAALFHDIHEARTGDADKLQRRYGDPDEKRALIEQLKGLGQAAVEIETLWSETEERTSEAGTIAKDAEILEMIFTARELISRGNKEAQAWIDGARPRLKTASAKALLEIVEHADPMEWLKEIDLSEVK